MARPSLVFLDAYVSSLRQGTLSGLVYARYLIPRRSKHQSQPRGGKGHLDKVAGDDDPKWMVTRGPQTVPAESG